MKINYLLFTDAMRDWLVTSRAQMNVKQAEVAKSIKLGKNFNTTQVLLSKLEQGGAKRVADKNWKKLVSFYTKNGAKPFTGTTAAASQTELPVVEAPSSDVKGLIKTLKTLKAESKSSWKMIAETVGIHPRTLSVFLRTGELGESSLRKVWAGLERLNGLEQKLVAQGSLEPVKEAKHAKAPKVVAPKKAKSSIIHAAPVLPTRVALAMRELEAIKILQEYDVTNRDFMNGSAAKMVRA